MDGFCVIVQNFAKIRQSAVELWPKPMFSNMASVRHLDFKILNFCHRIFVIVLIYFSVQNFIKPAEIQCNVAI